MKRAIFIVLMHVLSIACIAQNLVVNPGFDTWTKINKPAGWSTAQLCQKDSVTFMTGNYSCRHEGTISGTKSVGQKIAVSPGIQYSLSFYFKTIVTGTDHGCRIWCHWEDGANKVITDPGTDDILEPSTYMKSDSWQQFSVVVTSPSGSCYFILEVRTYQNSIAFLDDFDFEESVFTSNDEKPRLLPVIYPNPAHDYLIIDNIKNIRHIYIQNLMGVTIWSSNISSDQQRATVPVSQLADGLYIVVIKTPQGLITRKIVKRSD